MAHLFHIIGSTSLWSWKKAQNTYFITIILVWYMNYQAHVLNVTKGENYLSITVSQSSKNISCDFHWLIVQQILFRSTSFLKKNIFWGIFLVGPNDFNDRPRHRVSFSWPEYDLEPFLTMIHILKKKFKNIIIHNTYYLFLHICYKLEWCMFLKCNVFI